MLKIKSQYVKKQELSRPNQHRDPCWMHLMFNDDFLLRNQLLNTIDAHYVRIIYTSSRCHYLLISYIYIFFAFALFNNRSNLTVRENWRLTGACQAIWSRLLNYIQVQEDRLAGRWLANTKKSYSSWFRRTRCREHANVWTIKRKLGHTVRGGHCRVGNDFSCDLKRTFVICRSSGIQGSCNEFDMHLRWRQ